MGKNNEKIAKWVRFIITLLAGFVVGALGVVYSYGRDTGRDAERMDNIENHIDRVEKTVLDIEVSEEIQDEAIARHDKEIVSIKKDVEYIRKTVDRIESKLDNERN